MLLVCLDIATPSSSRRNSFSFQKTTLSSTIASASASAIPSGIPNGSASGIGSGIASGSGSNDMNMTNHTATTTSSAAVATHGLENTNTVSRVSLSTSSLSTHNARTFTAGMSLHTHKLATSLH